MLQDIRQELEVTHGWQGASPPIKPVPKMKLSLRIDRSNPDHHLYLNKGTWWIHFNVHLQDYTARRVRHSLGTTEVVEARVRREWRLGELVEGRGVA